MEMDHSALVSEKDALAVNNKVEVLFLWLRCRTCARTTQHMPDLMHKVRAHHKVDLWAAYKEALAEQQDDRRAHKTNHSDPKPSVGGD